ncbi:hypothetical protein GCM10009785_15070 [Brooklawnia cerclae]
MGRVAVVTQPHDNGIRAVPRLTLVTSPGCHFCQDAHSVLAEFAGRGLVELGTVDAESSEGLALVETHRPAMFPLVLLDGRFFSNGRLPRRKLAHVLGVDRAGH